MWLSIGLSFFCVLAIASLVGYSLWRGRRNLREWEAQFKPLNDGVVEAVFAVQPGGLVDYLQLQARARSAVGDIFKSGVWNAGDVTDSLHGLHI